MSFNLKGMVTETVSEETIRLDEFDDCIVSVVESFHGRHIVYNQEKILNKLMSRDGMDYTDALEFYEYNIKGGYYGELGPLFDLKTNDLW
tara:strand:+ start:353 stop:622 length:270 start_codon:yes stop_codon:yes gene_type:complete